MNDQNLKAAKVDYYCNRGWFNREVLMLYTLDHVSIIRKQLQDVDMGFKQKLQVQDLPILVREDFCKDIGQEIIIKIQQKMAESQDLEVKDIYHLFYQQNKKVVTQILIYQLISILCRVAFLWSISKLLSGMVNEKYNQAYNFSALAGILLLIEAIFGRSAVLKIGLLRSRITVGLIYVIFKKMTKLSDYSLNLAGIGKIMNMISSDVLKLDANLVFLSYLAVFPIGIIMMIILAAFTMGIFYLSIIIVSILVLLLQILVGQIKSKYQLSYLSLKDKRINILSQMLSSIRTIKMYCWQNFFNKKIQQVRNQEVDQLIKGGFGKSLQKAIANTSGNLSALVCFFFIYLFNNSELNTVKIMSSFFYIAYIQELIVSASKGISFSYDVKDMFNRIIVILKLQNYQMIRIDEQPRKEQQFSQKLSENELIKLKNFSCYWSKASQTAVLKRIDLSLQKGKFYGIFGEVGGGKSTFLSALMKQVPFFSGELSIKGSISYTQQNPLVYSGTIKKNILFGRPFQQQLYQKAIEASCLIEDLNNFQQADQTHILQKGSNLSGGQKARISLARAIYADSDIYLLDDPFSAVDSKVAARIYAKTIEGVLKNKTIILITHHINFLQKCSKVFNFKDGVITLYSQSSNNNLQTDLVEQTEQRPNVSKERSLKTQKIIGSSDNVKLNVTWRSYVKYLLYQKGNFILVFLGFSMFILSNLINIFFVKFLSSYDHQKVRLMKVNTTTNSFVVSWSLITNLVKENVNMSQFWFKAIFLQMLSVLVCFFQQLLFNYIMLRSSRKLHGDMVTALSRSKNSYLDTTPSGLIIGKFSTDICFLDTEMIILLSESIQGLVMIGSLFITIFFISYYFLMASLFNIILVVVVFTYCKDSIVQARKLDFSTRNLMFTIIRQTASGLIPFKLYNNLQSRTQELCDATDLSTRAYISHDFTSRALDIYLRMGSTFLFIFQLFLAIYITTPEIVALLGTSLVFLFKINLSIQQVLRNCLKTQTAMLYFESALILVNIEPQFENYSDYDEIIRAKQQYTNANEQSNVSQLVQIQIKNLNLKYRQGFPLALRNLNILIKPCEKVGVVGRTGSGKSSLMLALLRMYQPEPSSIYMINNQNAMKMGLHTLRHKISIIPQSPFIFSGTIRQNVDPFNTFTDEEILAIFEKCTIREDVENLDQKLDTKLTSANPVFSGGQKQLLCLSRALLMKSKIIILDEATSNIDTQTDEVIQRVLSQACSQKIVITIAHRIQTICNYDTILVMDQGQIKQSGSPQQLADQNGLFRQIIKKTGRQSIIIKSIRQSRDRKIIINNK